MFKFITKWFKKKPKEQELFSDNFKKLAKAVLERPKNKPYDDYFKSRILTPTDPFEFAKTLEFNNKFDVSTYNLSLLSDEAKTQIGEIVKKDIKKQMKNKLKQTAKLKKVEDAK
jgi:hypothetical protein